MSKVTTPNDRLTESVPSDTAHNRWPASPWNGGKPPATPLAPPPSRRALFGTGAALLAASAVLAATARAAAPQDADAVLIALCSRFDELERMSQQFQNSGDNDHLTDVQVAAVTTPWHDEQAELFPRILALPAATMAGFVARAKMAVLWAPDLLENPYEGWHMEMAGALMRDLLATDGRMSA